MDESNFTTLELGVLQYYSTSAVTYGFTHLPNCEVLSIVLSETTTCHDEMYHSCTQRMSHLSRWSKYK